MLITYCKMCYKTQTLNRNMFFSLYIYQKREELSERIEMEKRERERDRTREILFSQEYLIQRMEVLL